MRDYDITFVNLNLMYAEVTGVIDKQVYIPLGLLYMTSVLQKAGYKVDFRDYQLQKNDESPFSVESFLNFMENSADIVGISCMANLLPFTILAVEAFKESYPDKTVILGGVGPSAVAELIVENFHFVDIVAKGEGEVTIIELMESLKEKKNLYAVSGICFRKNGRYQVNPPRGRITNLDSLPLPAYEVLDFVSYDAAPSIVTSRGCPYTCAFCTENTIWGNRVIYRDINSVLEEMTLLNQRYGKSTFLFQDDNFVLGRERLLQFCDKLIESGLNVKWKCFGRINLMDEEIMNAMSKAGCVQVRYGIESGSNKTLRLIDKRFTIEQAKKIVAMSAKYFDSVHVSFIYGYPIEYESMEDFLQTVEKAVEFEVLGATALLFLLSPLPQNRIYNGYKGKLDFSKQLWSNFIATGHEDDVGKNNNTNNGHDEILDLVIKYPRIFPGFYTYDFENNVLPKLKIVKERGLFHRKKKYIPYDDKIDL